MLSTVPDGRVRFDCVALWTLYPQQSTLAIDADHVREGEKAFGFLRKLMSLGRTDWAQYREIARLTRFDNSLSLPRILLTARILLAAR
jgi:hypothetical protein